MQKDQKVVDQRLGVTPGTALKNAGRNIGSHFKSCDLVSEKELPGGNTDFCALECAVDTMD
jgi:hypothetical protein